MNHVTVFGVTVPAWILLPVVFFLWVTFFLFLKRIVFKAIKKITAKTENRVDDLFIEAANFPLTLLIFTSAAAVVERMLPLTVTLAENAELTHYFLTAFKATTIIAIVLFADKFLNGLFKNYSDRVDILRSSGGVARGFVRIIVIGLGLLILLDSFGVSITPLLASLGIGSLAVALALQPTLENFFSGIQLVIDKPIKVGHFVKLESGEEGYIHKIGWRSTWVRLLANNMIVIPNKVIVNAKLLNYYYPEKEMSTLVQVGVHYESDLEHVEKVTIQTAKETMNQVDGGVNEFEPFIRYHTFDAYSINFTVILRVHEFVDNYLLKHEFVKNLHKAYAKEGINIPYPIRAINNAQEKAFEKAKKE